MDGLEWNFSDAELALNYSTKTQGRDGMEKSSSNSIVHQFSAKQNKIEGKMQQNKLHLTYSNNEDLKKCTVNGYKEIAKDCNYGEILSESKQGRSMHVKETNLLSDGYKTSEDNDDSSTEHGMSFLDSKLMCEKHDNCELTHFCRKCEVPVCQLCRPSLEHKGHRTKRIGIAVTERKEKLSTNIKIENDKFMMFRRKLSFVENEKSNIRSSCDEVVARIRQRCAYMKNVLDTIANNLVKEVYYRKKDCLQQYANTQKEIQTEMKNSEDILEFMNALSEASNDKQFLEEYRSLKIKSCNERKLPRIWKEYVRFDHGPLSVKELKERFGSVSFVMATDGGAFTYENKEQYGRLTCSTKRSFRCERKIQAESDEDDSGPINAIIKSENQLWVSCGLSSKQISLLDENGKTAKSFRLRLKVEDITCSQDGDLIVSIFRDKAVKKVSAKGEVSNIFDVPYHPKGIDITKDGGYLVCMCDSFSTSVCEDSRRIVVKYTPEGEEEHIYEYDGDARLFTRPFRVTENTNGDVCVIDKTSMGSGQVIILDKSGLVKATYNGSRQPASTHTQKILSRFAPCDITCDQNGRIFIAESDNHKIYLLNKDGSYIGHFLTNESDFFCPQCITTDGNNQIWVGNEYGEIKMFTCDWQ